MSLKKENINFNKTTDKTDFNIYKFYTDVLNKKENSANTENKARAKHILNSRSNLKVSLDQEDNNNSFRNRNYFNLFTNEASTNNSDKRNASNVINTKSNNINNSQTNIITNTNSNLVSNHLSILSPNKSSINYNSNVNYLSYKNNALPSIPNLKKYQEKVLQTNSYFGKKSNTITNNTNNTNNANNSYTNYNKNNNSGNFHINLNFPYSLKDNFKNFKDNNKISLPSPLETLNNTGLNRPHQTLSNNYNINSSYNNTNNNNNRLNNFTNNETNVMNTLYLEKKQMQRQLELGTSTENELLRLGYYNNNDYIALNKQKQKEQSDQKKKFNNNKAKHFPLSKSFKTIDNQYIKVKKNNNNSNTNNTDYLIKLQNQIDDIPLGINNNNNINNSNTSISFHSNSLKKNSNLNSMSFKNLKNLNSNSNNNNNNNNLLSPTINIINNFNHISFKNLNFDSNNNNISNRSNRSNKSKQSRNNKPNSKSLKTTHSFNINNNNIDIDSEDKKLNTMTDMNINHLLKNDFLLFDNLSSRRSSEERLNDFKRLKTKSLYNRDSCDSNSDELSNPKEVIRKNTKISSTKRTVKFNSHLNNNIQKSKDKNSISIDNKISNSDLFDKKNQSDVIDTKAIRDYYSKNFSNKSNIYTNINNSTSNKSNVSNNDFVIGNSNSNNRNGINNDTSNNENYRHQPPKLRHMSMFNSQNVLKSVKESLSNNDVAENNISNYNDTNLTYNSTVTNMTNKNYFQTNYCPYCTHCNKIKEDKMEEYITIICKAKNVISKGFAAILRSDLIGKNNKLDCLFDLNLSDVKMNINIDKNNSNNGTDINGINSNINNHKGSLFTGINNISNLSNIINNEINNITSNNTNTYHHNTINNAKENKDKEGINENNNNINNTIVNTGTLNNHTNNQTTNINSEEYIYKQKVEKQLDELVEKFPRENFSQRQISKIVGMYLNALAESRVSYDVVLNTEVKNSFKKHLLARGLFFYYDNINDNVIDDESIKLPNKRTSTQIDKYNINSNMNKKSNMNINNNYISHMNSNVSNQRNSIAVFNINNNLNYNNMVSNLKNRASLKAVKAKLNKSMTFNFNTMFNSNSNANSNSNNANSNGNARKSTISKNTNFSEDGKNFKCESKENDVLDNIEEYSSSDDNTITYRGIKSTKRSEEKSGRTDKKTASNYNYSNYSNTEDQYTNDGYSLYNTNTNNNNNNNSKDTEKPRKSSIRKSIEKKATFNLNANKKINFAANNTTINTINTDKNYTPTNNNNINNHPSTNQTNYNRQKTKSTKHVKSKASKVIINNKFVDLNEFELKIDPEIEELLDPLSRENIKEILNKKHVKHVLIQEQTSEQSAKHEMKSLFLFNIFLQILSEISVKEKEKAYLLYKFFKTYFAQQNSKYGLILSKLNDKIRFYKDLCKLIVQQKHHEIDSIELIAEILSSSKVSEENLTNHKKLIKDLLVINNEKREELYVKNSEIEILNKELHFFFHDFDKIKNDKELRTKLTLIKKYDLEKIINNIHSELSHLPENIDRSLLVNADIFLFLSGHRKYFYEQKEYYQRELDKQKEKVHEAISDKEHYFDLYKSIKEESNLKIAELNESMRTLREMHFKTKSFAAVQTDIDIDEFNKIEHHHFSFVLKKNEVMKISILAEFMDNVIFSGTNLSLENKIHGNVKFVQLSMASILNFISELYENKLIHDIDCDLNRKVRMTLDDYIYYYMKNVFQHKEHIKENIEKLLFSAFNSFNSDVRVYYFCRFGGFLEYKYINQINTKDTDSKSNKINDKNNKKNKNKGNSKTKNHDSINNGNSHNISNKQNSSNISLISNEYSTLRREVLDCYLLVISSFTFPLCKLIDSEIDDYIISLDSCVNVLNKFKYLNLLDFSIIQREVQHQSSTETELNKMYKALITNVLDIDEIIQLDKELHNKHIQIESNNNENKINNSSNTDSVLDEISLSEALFNKVKIYDNLNSEETYNYHSFKDLIELFLLFSTLKKFPLPMEIEKFSWEEFMDNIYYSNVTFDLSKELILGLLLKYFKSNKAETLYRNKYLANSNNNSNNNNKINLTTNMLLSTKKKHYQFSILNKNLLELFSIEKVYLFAQNSKRFKINLSYFIYTLMNYVEKKYKALEKKLSFVFDKFDTQCLGILKLNRVEEAMKYIITRGSANPILIKRSNEVNKNITGKKEKSGKFSDNEDIVVWRISNFIASKFGSNYYDFVSKQDFIAYCFDEKFVLPLLDNIY